DYPITPGGYNSRLSGQVDVVVSKFDASAHHLLWSTFLGGEFYDGYGGAALALDASGNAVLAGETESPDFPTTPGAYDRSFDDSTDVFVARLDLSGPTDVASGWSDSRFMSLLPAVPNPFREVTDIRYRVKQEVQVKLDVLDATGRRVATLARGVE